MAKTKYKEYYERMIESEPELFDKFREVHQKYMNDDEKWQDEYNKIGAKVQELAHEWENKLCHQTEGGKFAKYAGGLAEKFQAEIKKDFPMFDHIGLKVMYSKPADIQDDDFKIKKINLN